MKQRRPALLHVGLEMAVGTLVPCDRTDQILTCLWAPSCHSHADALVLAGNSPAFGIASVSGVLGETARTPASTLGTRVAGFSSVGRVDTQTSGSLRLRLYF